MKKIIALSMLFVMLLSFASCGAVGSNKSDYLGTWKCDEFVETDLVTADRYLFETYTFLESGAGHSQITLTKAWEDYEAGYEYPEDDFDWELKDGVLIVHTKRVGDIKFKFDESDSNHSTLLNISEGNRVYKKVN